MGAQEGGAREVTQQAQNGRGHGMVEGFDAVVGSFKAKTGTGVDAIHPSMWSGISEKGKQLHTDLLNDV